MFGWLLRLFGIGRKQSPPAATNSQVNAVRSAAPAPLPVSQDPAQFMAQRRRVVVYVARTRVPIRQAAAARLEWIHDLGKVYEAIRSSPTAEILDRAGDVGSKYEPIFRECLSQAQAIEPSAETEPVHEELVSWLTALHGACTALMDARRLKDRSMLGIFRERLSQGRRHAAALSEERRRLFEAYRLQVRPSVAQRRRASAAAEETSDQAAAERTSRQPSRDGRRRAGGAAPPRRPRPRGDRPGPQTRRARSNPAV